MEIALKRRLVKRPKRIITLIPLIKWLKKLKPRKHYFYSYEEAEMYRQKLEQNKANVYIRPPHL